MDVLSEFQRKYCMQRIRSMKNRSTEEVLAKALMKRGIRGWRRKQKVFGSPDFIFWNERLAIFVDGCFWHGCQKHYVRPRNNRTFWDRKYVTNKKRDRLVNTTLRKRGWKVLRIWEHDLKDHPIRVVSRIKKVLKNGQKGK